MPDSTANSNASGRTGAAPLSEWSSRGEHRRSIDLRQTCVAWVSTGVYPSCLLTGYRLRGPVQASHDPLERVAR